MSERLRYDDVADWLRARGEPWALASAGRITVDIGSRPWATPIEIDWDRRRVGIVELRTMIPFLVDSDDEVEVRALAERVLDENRAAAWVGVGFHLAGIRGVGARATLFLDENGSLGAAAFAQALAMLRGAVDEAAGRLMPEAGPASHASVGREPVANLSTELSGVGDPIALAKRSSTSLALIVARLDDTVLRCTTPLFDEAPRSVEQARAAHDADVADLRRELR